MLPHACILGCRRAVRDGYQHVLARGRVRRTAHVFGEPFVEQMSTTVRLPACLPLQAQVQAAGSCTKAVSCSSGSQTQALQAPQAAARVVSVVIADRGGRGGRQGGRGRLDKRSRCTTLWALWLARGELKGARLESALQWQVAVDRGGVRLMARGCRVGVVIPDSQAEVHCVGSGVGSGDCGRQCQMCLYEDENSRAPGLVTAWDRRRKRGCAVCRMRTDTRESLGESSMYACEVLGRRGGSE